MNAHPQMTHHEIVIRTGYTEDSDHQNLKFKFCAYCKTCGWMSPGCPTVKAADVAGDEHVLAVS